MNPARVIELAARLSNALFALQRIIILGTNGETLKTLVRLVINLMDELRRELQEGK